MLNIPLPLLPRRRPNPQQTRSLSLCPKQTRQRIRPQKTRLEDGSEYAIT